MKKKVLVMRVIEMLTICFIAAIFGIAYFRHGWRAALFYEVIPVFSALALYTSEEAIRDLREEVRREHRLEKRKNRTVSIVCPGCGNRYSVIPNKGKTATAALKYCPLCGAPIDLGEFMREQGVKAE